MAEREGFEPSIRYNRIPDFESGAFDHSATSADCAPIPYPGMGAPGTCLLTVRMRRVGFEPTMFTTWVTVLQTACFSHLHTGAYGGRPGRPPFSYVSTIAYGPGQICIIFKLTRHSHSCTPLSLYTVNPAPRPALPAAPARLYRR